jgi:HEAT repeat protein
VIRTDPDPVVRRLAILPLARWRHEARPYVDAVRVALDDPDPSVRDTAVHVLPDQRLS